VTTDDEHIAHLGGRHAGDDLDDAERTELDDTRALLGDPSVWADAPIRLEDAVVAAVARAASAQPSAVAPRSARARRHRRWRPVELLGAAGAAAALVVAVVLAPGHDTARSELAASLRATELVPGAAGHATFTRTDSGWQIDLDATGLPRLDDGRFYQGWLRDDAGVLVAIGTFNEPRDVVLWAGVSPREFATITVTEELADGDASSSGRRVLVGPITPR
jgi:hypothetical protein